MKWEKAGARYKEPVVAANQISPSNSPGTELAASSGLCPAPVI